MLEIVHHDHAKELIELSGDYLENRETEARCFSGKWTKTVPGVTARPAKRLRVFEARSVVDVPLAPGRLRHAEREDLPLMAKWIAKFSSEAIGKESEPGKAERNAVKYITEENCTSGITMDRYPSSRNHGP